MGNKLKLILGGAAVSLLLLAFMVLQSHILPEEALPEGEAVPGAPVSAPSVSYDLVFRSTLPILAIETDGQSIPYGESIPGRVYVYDGAQGANTVAEAPELCLATDIHYRGQSSAGFDKKSYRLEFREGEKGLDVPLLGMAAGHDWVLNGPYLDKSLMRNALSYSLARQIMFYAPDYRYCEVYLNGEYVGLYLLLEVPRLTETRIPFTRTALASGETSYLLQRDRSWEIRSYTTIVGQRPRQPGAAGIDVDMDGLDTFGLRAGLTQVPLYVVYPNTENITAAQFRYMENDISAFERALYADYFTDPERGYRHLIDMDSFAEYYLLAEFSMNLDSGYYSTYVCKELGGKLRLGPVWDFNNAYNNYVTYGIDPEEGFVIADNNWFARLTRDRVFVDAVVEKWRQLRRDILSDESLLRFLDETGEQLADAIGRNNRRWAYVFRLDMLSGDRDVFSYEQAQQQLRDFLVRRGAYLDENITRLYANCVN